MKHGWIDAGMYPFEHHALETGAHEMHYLDEGRGEPIVFVHGDPTWSFLWRHLVRDLRDDHRCVAPDHLGFGLSDKPQDADYTPATHARRLEELIERLELRDITLVVHDFGGPIGLHYALRHPDNVRRVVVMNTWMWSGAVGKAAGIASRFLGGPVGRFLCRRLNFAPRVVLKSVYADKRKLTPDIHRHYLAPFPTPDQRQAPWVLARELVGSNDWYDGLWSERHVLESMPALVLWGMRDPLLPARHLDRWEEVLPLARIERMEGAGHFIQEEAPQEVIAHLRAFLASTERGGPPGDAPSPVSAPGTPAPARAGRRSRSLPGSPRGHPRRR